MARRSDRRRARDRSHRGMDRRAGCRSRVGLRQSTDPRQSPRFIGPGTHGRIIDADAIGAHRHCARCSGARASGYVVARRQATVSAKATGRVAEVLIEEGQRVEQDQVIARLDSSGTTAALAEAAARLAEAQADLEAAWTAKQMDPRILPDMGVKVTFLDG